MESDDGIDDDGGHGVNNIFFHTFRKRLIRIFSLKKKNNDMNCVQISTQWQMNLLKFIHHLHNWFYAQKHHHSISKSFHAAIRQLWSPSNQIRWNWLNWRAIGAHVVLNSVLQKIELSKAQSDTNPFRLKFYKIITIFKKKKINSNYHSFFYCTYCSQFLLSSQPHS